MRIKKWKDVGKLNYKNMIKTVHETDIMYTLNPST